VTFKRKKQIIGFSSQTKAVYLYHLGIKCKTSTEEEGREMNELVLARARKGLYNYNRNEKGDDITWGLRQLPPDFIK
jgi:hypothetical protein